MTGGEAFPFAIDQSMRRWSRLFGIHPEICGVQLTPHRLMILFGRWSLVTSPSNISDVTITGPYERWRVAGPAHLSPSDRGVTFATTADAGVCLSFHEPVPAIEPFGLVRHPAATVTVADPHHFAERVRAVLDTPKDGLPPSVEKEHRQGTYRASVGGVVRWLRRDRSVRHATTEVGRVEPPERLAPSPVIQRFEDGVGPAYHRRYEVLVQRPNSDAAGAMARVQANFNLIANQQLGPITKLRGRLGEMAVGDRYVVALAGPWSGPVEVLEVTPNCFRLVTLNSHLEAGMIDFSSSDQPDGLVFTIESWATSGGHGARAVYDIAGIARALQAEMWAEACELFVGVVDGVQAGPVTVTTEKGSSE